MPRKSKKQSKKRVYKKRKSTTSTTNKNKNIIRINVGGTGSSGGSSIIPLPYPSSVGTQMFPSTQPVNIYNSMSKSPFDREYNPELKASQEQSNSIPIPEVVKVQQPEPKAEPIPIAPFTPDRPEKFQPVGGGGKSGFQPVGGTPDLIKELMKRQEQLKLKKLKDIMDAEKTKKAPETPEVKPIAPLPIKPVKPSRPIPTGETSGIFSPIGNYESNPMLRSNREDELRKELILQGKTNREIGQIIRRMKDRKELI